METIFKVGMKVYDSFNFPEMEGVVKSIEKDCMGYWFVNVKFDKFQIVQSYTPKGYLSSGHKPTLSTKPYKVELQGSEQKAPVPTYDEILMEKGVYVSITKPLILPDENLANAFEALAKLIWLRNFYNEGWQPDWRNGDTKKYVIIVKNRDFLSDENYMVKKILAFRTKETRDKFLEEQMELLEIAKPLL